MGAEVTGDENAGAWVEVRGSPAFSGGRALPLCLLTHPHFLYMMGASCCTMAFRSRPG